jgi:type IV secretion system protein TrbG
MTLSRKRTGRGAGHPLLAVGLVLTAGTAAGQQEPHPAPALPASQVAPNIPPEPSLAADADAPNEVNKPNGPDEPGESATDPAPGLPPGVLRAIPGRVPEVPTLPSAASQPVQIGPPAQQALAESHAWAENPNAMPTRDNGGRVVFVFSESAPTIVCAPLHVCDIELQPGEVVQGVPHVGDAVRWKIAPAFSGEDERKTMHLIIKPTQADLDTNLVVPTNRHTYHLRLVSSSDRYVSSVGFFYPEDDLQSWKAFSKSLSSGVAMASARTSGGGDMPIVAVNRLNFDYKIKVVKGKPRFKPLHAMDDGYHTYIAMNEDLPQGEAPALIGISRSGEERMINYRLQGNIYVVDGITYELALVSGAGSNEQRVELQRHICQQRGWLGVCWDPKD